MVLARGLRLTASVLAAGEVMGRVVACRLDTGADVGLKGLSIFMVGLTILLELIRYYG